ncbi:MAG: hypothetical protein GY877_01935 [Hyphomicrobium sp.]|nr:hypothetical protein [Hyphomicrobium sp.]
MAAKLIEADRGGCSAFAAAFALPSGRLATPWTQLWRQVAAIRSRPTIRRML